LYISSGDSHRSLFGRALAPMGISDFDYYYEMAPAKLQLQAAEYDLVLIHGSLPGVTVDDEFVAEMRAVRDVPMCFLGHQPGAITQDERTVVLTPPVTAASLAEGVAGMLKPNESKLVERLLRSPGFETFSADAITFLLSASNAVQLSEGEVLFSEGEPGDSMYFVLTGSIALSIGARELEEVGAGGIFGEMATLEGLQRTAAATAKEVTVLLKVTAASLEPGDVHFRAILFELLTRSAIRRLRSTNSLLSALDGR
jgi:hypothetical protein